MKIEEILKQTAQTLKNKGFESPRAEAEIIVSHVLKIDKPMLYTRYNKVITETEIKEINNILERRLKHEPIQYLTSKAFFYGLEFIVEPPVLIPRPETETLVETTLNLVKDNNKRITRPKIIDIGTGSGIIAITLLKHLPSATAYAVDIIKPTLAWKNAKIHKVNDRLYLIKADLLDAVNIKVDFIVSNPPYIPTSVIPTLQEEVKTFESKVALDGGKDGLAVIRKIIKDAPAHLNKNGVLILEFSPEQVGELKEEAEKCFESVEFINDLSGKSRVVVCRDSKIPNAKTK
jgi:release factor glutamine methyltransferase